MARWAVKIEFKHLLNQKGKTNRQVAKEVAQFFRDRIKAKAGNQFLDEQAADALDAVADEMDKVADNATLSEDQVRTLFNELLEEVYDIGNEYRIWYGVV